MRFLFVSTETRPLVGGIARCLDGWLSGLAESGHEVCVLSLLPEAIIGRTTGLPARAYRESWLGLLDREDRIADCVLPLRKVRSAVFLLRRKRLILKRFGELVDTFQPDWTIFAVLNPTCCAPVVEASNRGLRRAAIAYGSEVHPERAPNHSWLRRTLHRMDHVVAISEYTRRRLEEWGVPATRVSVIHPALAPDVVARTYGASARLSEQANPNGALRLLTICRLVERKGVQTVLQALQQLRVEMPQLRYDVVGDGPLRGELERLARELGLDDIVRFHGQLTDREREALLRACDIFVLAPFESGDGDVEGFGIVYLEAGLFGKPVIGSCSGGVPDAIRNGETGLLVAPQDASSLADAIHNLASDAGRRTWLGRNGRHWAASHTPILCGRQLAGAFNHT